ncbi:MAG: hypothetical protein WA667_20710 [Candidatus Nitrosopolaris sp.]
MILDACYSEPQAKAISNYVDCVIGMSQAVTDSGAREFAAHFYQALGFGKSIQDAFDLGIVELKLFNISDENIPKLTCRVGVDPSNIFILNGKSRNVVKADDEIHSTYSSSASQISSQPGFFDWRVWLPSYPRGS